jgi:hypothetical protein
MPTAGLEALAAEGLGTAAASTAGEIMRIERVAAGRLRCFDD